MKKIKFLAVLVLVLGLFSSCGIKDRETAILDITYKIHYPDETIEKVEQFDTRCDYYYFLDNKDTYKPRLSGHRGVNYILVCGSQVMSSTAPLEIISWEYHSSFNNKNN